MMPAQGGSLSERGNTVFNIKDAAPGAIDGGGIRIQVRLARRTSRWPTA